MGSPSAIVADLTRLLGADGVLSGVAERATYESDGVTLLRAPPVAIALPDSTAGVVKVLTWAHRAGVPIVARGAGTGLSGGATATAGGVVLCTARLTKILRLDAENRLARVEAGVVNLHVTRAAEPFGLAYAPDPSSQAACTIGGNVAENSGGPHTLKYGVTTNHVLALSVVLHDGTVVELGHDTGELVGYDAVGCFVGSEGTFGVATEATLRLVTRPEATRTLLAAFDSVRAATESVSAIIASGIVPAALEMIDAVVIGAVEDAYHAGLPRDAAAVLLVELDGVTEGLDDEADAVDRLCLARGARSVRRAQDEAERSLLWKARKRAFGAMGRISPSYYTHDCVIPRSKLPEVLERVTAIATRHGVTIANVFHAGDGNLHPLILFDERDRRSVRSALAAGEEVLATCLAAGGSLSGEHGIGAEKREWMDRVFDAPSLAAMRRVKAAFDPSGRMNPDKVLPTPGRCFDVPKRPGGGG